jgi:hypothetical protein
MATCVNHPDKRAVGRGLCRNCYAAWRRSRTDRSCSNCGKPEVQCRGLCNACYQLALMSGTAEEYEAGDDDRRREKTPCVNHPDRKAIAKGLCGACYERNRRLPDPARGRHCKKCSAPSIYAKGLCLTCYQTETGARIRGMTKLRKKYAMDETYREKVKARRQTAEIKLKKRLWHLRTLYGLTEDDVQAMLVQQSHHCAICPHPITLMSCHVDHDHRRSGRHSVRGLLCRRCNFGLGMFEDDPERMIAAAMYIRRFMPPE